MREIKFRAWAKDQCSDSYKMYYIFDMNSKGSGTGINIGMEFSYFENKTLMQFTGLKDKNGKEIYEGDIVKLHTIFGFLDCEVVFSKGRFSFWNNKRDEYFDVSFSPDGEVIGNKFENPELLK